MSEPVFVTDPAEQAEISRAIANGTTGYTVERVVWGAPQAEIKPAFDNPALVSLFLIETKQELPSYLALLIGSGDSKSLVIRRYDFPQTPNSLARDEFNRLAPALQSFAFAANDVFNNPKPAPIPAPVEDETPVEESEQTTQPESPSEPVAPPEPPQDVFTGAPLPPAPEPEPEQAEPETPSEGESVSP